MAQPQFGERAEYREDDVCYRHSDRPSFTLCQRCGRTICGDCQSQESVGVLCPDCVQELVRASRANHPATARVAARKLSDRSTPVVTYTIMAVCVIVWALQWFSGTVTHALWYAPVYSLPQQFEPWRAVTAMFTHSPGNFFHIFFNMYALWLFGRSLELQLGRLRYAVVYLLSGIGGSVAVQLWGYTSFDALRTPTVGASGAIFGILAATLVVYRTLNINISALAVLLAVNFGIGLLPGTNISWQAHLGGMIIGAVVMLVIIKTAQSRKRTAQVGILVGICAVLCALSLSYFVVSPLALMGA